MAEIRRVLGSPRRLLLLLALMLLAAYWLSPPDRWGSAMEYRDAQREFLASYAGKSTREIYDDLYAETDGGSYLVGQPGAIFQKAAYQVEFDARLQAICSKAENLSTVSIFAGSPYSQANVKKTAADYARLEGLPLTLGLDRPVLALMENGKSDFLVGIWMLAVVYAFLAERRRGLWNVVCASPRGRGALPLWRLATLGLGALLGVSAITFTELALTYSIHGGIQELGRYIQSIELFFGFTYPMTIGQFWLFYLSLRILGAFVLGLVMWLMFEVFSDRRMAAAILAGGLGLELAMTKVAGGEGYLRVINLFSFLQPRNLVTDYENLNLFGKPVGQLTLVAWAALVLSVLSLMVIFWRYARRRPTDGYAWLDKVSQWFTNLVAPLGYHTGLLRHTFHQIFSVGRGAVILLAALAVGFTLAEPRIHSENDAVAIQLESYQRQAQGPLTQETWDKLEIWETKLAENQEIYAQLQSDRESGILSQRDFEEQSAPYSNLWAVEAALPQFRAYLEDISTRENPHVMPQWVYITLLDEHTSLQALCLVVTLLVFVFQSGAQKSSGMGKSQEATPLGRTRLKVIQHLAAWMVTALFCAMIWGFQFGRLWFGYGSGLPFVTAPAGCLTFLSDAGNATILGYWGMEVLKKTLLTCGFSSLILVVTKEVSR